MDPARILDINLYVFFPGHGAFQLAEVIQSLTSKSEQGGSTGWTFFPRPVQLSPRIILFESRLFHDSEVNETLKYNILHTLRLELRGIEEEYGVELVILPSETRSSPPRIAVFDMDSTLIRAEVIDEIARSVGKMESVAAITEMAMNGHVDFAESLKLRVKLLKGVPITVWDELKARIEFMPGARELTRALSRLDIKMAVFSGGFQEMALWVGSELGLHRAAANKLVASCPTAEFSYPHLTGELDTRVPIVTAEKKKELLEAFAKEHNVSLAQAICVGDGANDLKMLKAVGSSGGMAIAFRAKSKVQLEAPNRINSKTLADLLFLLGKDQSEVDELTRNDPITIANSGFQTQLMPGTDAS